MVNAHDLPVQGDNPRFHGGNAMGIGQHTTPSDPRLAQASTQRAARLVILQLLTAFFLQAFSAAHNSEEFDMRTESRKIGGDVPCASQTIRLRHKIHHRDGRFRR